MGEKREHQYVEPEPMWLLAVPALAREAPALALPPVCLPSLFLSLLIVATCAPLYCATVRHVTHS